MNAITLIVFAIICTVIAYVLIQLCIVFPAWKKYRIQKATTSLSKCLQLLNSDSLPTAKIKNGHYLHDKFYRLLISIFMCDNPTIKSTANISYDAKTELDMNKFRTEIDNLDIETRRVIDEALSAITQIVFLNNPIKFSICLKNTMKSRKNLRNTSLRNKMVRGGEYLTVRDEISFDNHCHA